MHPSSYSDNELLAEREKELKAHHDARAELEALREKLRKDKDIPKTKYNCSLL